MMTDLAAERDQILRRMHDRLDAFVLYAEPALLLDPMASADASLLVQFASRRHVDTGRPVADREFRHSAVLLAGWFHRMRAWLLPDEEAIRASLRTSEALFRSGGTPDDANVPQDVAGRMDGPSGDRVPSRAEGLSGLAHVAYGLWEETGQLEALDRAITMGRGAVEEGEPGSSAYVRDLDFLSATLRTRSQITGSGSDAEEAVEFGLRARSAAEEADDHLFSSLHHLGLALSHRARLAGSADALDSAIAVHHRAIAVGIANGVAEQGVATAFQGLSIDLLLRYQARKDLADLDAAVVAGTQAVTRAPEADPAILHNLCYMLTLRAQATGDATDLVQAIRVGQDAVDAAPLGHPERPAALNDLSVAWGFVDLDTAIELAREAVELSPDRDARDARKATRLANLAQQLWMRFESDRRQEDIDEAVELLDQALGLLPRHHPKRAEVLRELAQYLDVRFHAFRRLEDLRRILDMRQAGP
ncbi:hypothetical protein ACFWIJ_18115 [Streptomyces sp. NPDC127079]|uniref:hypothetical protein n=1 Tax=Streptomyces sp. NPDC127079 TaxID=3347132 RepID=UPI003649A6C6